MNFFFIIIQDKIEVQKMKNLYINSNY